MRHLGRRMVGAVVPAGVAVVLALAGCGSSASTSSSSTAEGGTATAASTSDGTADTAAATSLPDPCGLLTTAEISSATGLSFGAPEPNDLISGDDRAACDWVTTGTTFATAQVLIATSSAAPFDDEKAGTKDTFGLDVVDISVPGAARAFTIKGGNIVAMDMGDIYLQVSFTPSSSDDVTDTTTGLAASAAAKVS